MPLPESKLVNTHDARMRQIYSIVLVYEYLVLTIGNGPQQGASDGEIYAKAMTALKVNLRRHEAIIDGLLIGGLITRSPARWCTITQKGLDWVQSVQKDIPALYQRLEEHCKAA